MNEEILEYIAQHPKGKKQLADIQAAFEHVENIEEILQSYVDENILFIENNQYMNREQAGIVEGRISINKAGMGFLDIEGRDSIRIEEREQHTALHGDVVLVKAFPWQLYGTVVKVLERKRSHVVGTFLHNGRKLQFVPDEERLQEKIFHVSYPKDFTPIDGMKVMFEIVKYGIPIELQFEEVIGYKDDPGVDISSILLDHDIHAEFDEDVKKQVRMIPQEISWQDKVGRKDLTNENTVTIDGDDSKDFDDAVSVVRNKDGFILKVSIADVSHYVTEDSPLDKEALKRGCSTYVTDRVVPMIPHELSNGICSLNPHVERLTITCEMKVNFAGEITEYEIYPSFIRSTERMTYKNVNRILDGDLEVIARYKHLGTLFFDLRDCANAIHYHRTQKGAIEFNSTEADILCDANGHPIDIKPKKRGYAEEIIEDCMIAANVSVASFMRWQEIPAIYRIHEEPKAARIKDFIRTSELMNHKLIVGKGSIYPNTIQKYLQSVKDTPEYPVLSMLMLRCMQKAKYDNRCVGHFGLAEEDYLHFTSPIRRYPDLIVHRMLRKYSFEGCTDLNERVIDDQKTNDFAEQSSIRERASADAEFACVDMKKAEYMQDHVGKVYNGIITSVQSYGFYVELENTVEGLVHVNSLHGFYRYDQDRMQLVGRSKTDVYRVGMQVRVKCTGASKANGTVDFMVLKSFKSVSSKDRNDRKNKSHKTRTRNNRKEVRNKHGRKKQQRKNSRI